jgi:hypothetical protein
MNMRRGLIRIAGIMGAGALLVGSVGRAEAGVEAWRVNEVASSNGGDPTIRFVELYAPPSAIADNCFYPTTRLEILDGDGALLGSVTPCPSTTCYAGDTYFLFAPPEAAAFYGVPHDAALPYAIPASGGQVCLRSSATRYDCTRWGVITNAIPDFGDPSDTTGGPTLVDGASLARVDTTDIVAMDFELQMPPTPRQPNDGTVWFPPDAGPTPDAAPPADAASAADARQFFDAPPSVQPDARENPPNWLNADPGGGGCSIGRGPVLSFFHFTALLLMIFASGRVRR